MEYCFLQKMKKSQNRLTKDSKYIYCPLSVPPFFRFLDHGILVQKILFCQTKNILFYEVLSFAKNKKAKIG